MGVKTYLFTGALTGLVAGILIDIVTVTPAAYLRLTHLATIVFAVSVSAFIYEGRRPVSEDGEPSSASSKEPSRPLRRALWALRRTRS